MSAPELHVANLDAAAGGDGFAALVEEPGESAGSLLERVKQKRREIAGRLFAEITIPETGGLLVARYRYLDPTSEVDAIARRARQAAKSDTELQLLVALDVLIAACEGFYVRGDDGTLLPLDGEAPVRYDPRLAAALEVEAGSAREIVRAVFNGNEHAAFEHSQRLQAWMQERSRDVDQQTWG